MDLRNPHVQSSKGWSAIAMGAGVLVSVHFARFDMLHGAGHTSLALCPVLVNRGTCGQEFSCVPLLGGSGAALLGSLVRVSMG